jgi:hypothetical protein
MLFIPFIVFIKVLDRPVIGLFTGIGKQASGSFAASAVVCDAFAAFSVMRAGNVSTGTIDSIVVASHCITP